MQPLYFTAKTHADTDKTATVAPRFDCIGLIGRADKSSVIATLHELIVWLSKQQKRIWLNADTADLLDNAYLAYPCLTVVDNKTLKKADLVIVIGGDGSMLQAAQIIAGSSVPILGINRGRVGFLADVLPDEMKAKLTEVLGGHYLLDRRFLLSMQIWQHDILIASDVAFNDIVLHAGKSVHTIDYQLSIDGQDVYRQHADGLIIATPTGSTAYNLSAGGPIIHPKLDAICLSPMYPHTLTSRPIVVSGDSQIALQVHKDNRTQPMVSCDGKASVAITCNQILKIHKFHTPITLLHPAGFDFYQACRTKLNWSLYSDEFTLTSQS